MSKIFPIHNSPYNRLQPLPPGGFELRDSFWSPRLDTLRKVTLPTQFTHMEETGRIENFRRASGSSDQPHQGFVFNDSDVYKWLEAASLLSPPRPRGGAGGGVGGVGGDALPNQIETLTHLILSAQQPDGYLNTAFLFDEAPNRWTNIRDKHELYCAGHFIEAVLAAQDDELLAAATRLADLICGTFGDEPGKIASTPGHPEIEIALIKLYRATGDPRYLAQARYFIDARGHGLIGGQAYHQDHVPFRDLDKMAGHAVRALYLNTAAADLYAETGDPTLLETLTRLWERTYQRQVYLTGGLGARHSGESFGEDYELPNATAYSETCAAVAAIFWNWRMLLITADARYADALEMTLYNAALSGISLDGDKYFYTNPLASEGTHRRAHYFNCACCPPNLARLLASLPQYFVTTSENAVWLHLYAAGEFRLPSFHATIATHYPWDGHVRITIDTASQTTLRLRVPGWTLGDARISVNGDPRELHPEPVEGPGYIELTNHWAAGDHIDLNFPMPPRFIASHPAVIENIGRIALARGPLIYCVESNDPHPERLVVDTSAPVQEIPANGLIHLALQAAVTPASGAWANELYRTHPRPEPVEGQTVNAIPYFAWANGAPASMRVWLRTIR